MFECEFVMNQVVNNITRVGEEVVAVGPMQRLDTPGAQSVCRESLQTMHLDQTFIKLEVLSQNISEETNLNPILPNFILLAQTPHFSLFSHVFCA